MTLNSIVENSNYVTDEDMISSNLLGVANTALSEVNAKCGTRLPFYVSDQISVDTYKAIPDTWQLRLLEPYLAYSIMANDGDTNARDFHYNRFLAALADFTKNGISDIQTEDEEGNPTGYEGNSKSYRLIDVSDVTVHWKGWL